MSILVHILLNKEPSLAAGLSQTAFGGNRNPPDSGGILSKYRNSCPQEFLRKIPVKSKKNGIPATSPKPRSCEKFLWKTQEKKKSSGFLDTKNKFLKTGIGNLGKDKVSI
jgi:hypothetical protein